MTLVMSSAQGGGPWPSRVRSIVGELEPRLERAFDFAAGQVRTTIERYPDFFPIYTEGGRWKHRGELWTDWCGGFHAGMMWLIAGRTGDARWRRDGRALLAAAGAPPARPRGPRPRVHLPQHLSALASPDGRRAPPPGPDHGRPDAGHCDSTPGAVPPLVPGAGEPVHRHHDERAADLPRRRRGRRPRPVRAGRRALPHDRAHARPSRRLDGPRGDLRPGDRRSSSAQSTQQGLRPDSTWTRGLAWSLYGFGTVFGYTRDPADLEVARRNADCFLARCPDGLVPPWDFDVPDGPDRIADSSAAAIAASGLWDLAALTASGDPTGARRYRDADTDDPRLALHRPLRGLVHARLGGRPETRRLSLPQAARASTNRSCGAISSSSRPWPKCCPGSMPKSMPGNELLTALTARRGGQDATIMLQFL